MGQIPNYLTLTRILLIPFYLYFFLQQEYLISGAIFIFSISTDLLDGYIARKYNLQTKLGKILDPLADKLTVISILIVLLFVDLIPNTLAIILLLRELIIFISSSLVYLFGFNIIDPTRMGKISMFFLYLSLAGSLMGFSITAKILMYIAIPLNIISAVDYLISGWNFFNNTL